MGFHIYQLQKEAFLDYKWIIHSDQQNKGSNSIYACFKCKLVVSNILGYLHFSQSKYISKIGNGSFQSVKAKISEKQKLQT